MGTYDENTRDTIEKSENVYVILLNFFRWVIVPKLYALLKHGGDEICT